MATFFQAGGWGMFVVMGLCVVTLFNAALFARKPSEQRLVMIRALSTAVCFSSVTAAAMDFSQVFYKVPEMPGWDGSPHIPMVGYAESLSPVVLGAGMLTLVWMVVAVGVRRVSELHADHAAL